MTFATDAAVERIARGVVARALPKVEWTHAAHFAAAVHWLTNSEYDAFEEAPGFIRAYNQASGVQNTDTDGYHETITMASLAAAGHALRTLPPETAPHDAVNALLASPLGRPDWLLAYWSKDRLFSVDARRTWIDPDVAPTPFDVTAERARRRRPYAIALADPRAEDVTALLGAHRAHTAAHTPACAGHMLDVDALAAPDIDLWAARENGRAIGCVALRRLDSMTGEIKSMHTADAQRGRGVARALLRRLETEAYLRGFTQLRLETGKSEGFAASRALYRSCGFVWTPSFGDYVSDDFSYCMAKSIAG